MLSWEPKENKVISFTNWWLRGLAMTWGTSRTEVLLLQMKWWLILLKQNFHSKFIGCHFPKRHQSMRPDGEWCASQLTACPLLRVPAQHPDNSQQGWADWKHEEYASRMPCRSLFGCSQCYPSWLSTGLQLLMLLLTTGLAVDWSVYSSMYSEHLLLSPIWLHLLHRDINFFYMAGIFLQLKHTSQGHWGISSTCINTVEMSVTPQQPYRISTVAPMVCN